MKLPYLVSRNFNSYEVSRGANNIPEDQFYATAYLHGYLQAVRDSCANRFGGQFQGLSVTSSNRAAYNQDVKNAASNSYHIFGKRSAKSVKSGIACAADVRPLGISLEAFYNHVRQNFKGEVYLNRAEQIIHLAPVPFENEFWIQ